MDTVVVLARIVLRDPLTLAWGLVLAVLIGAGWLWWVKGRGWSRTRRLCAVLSAASLGLALAIVLAREDVTFGSRWYCLVNPGLLPGTAEEALNLVLFAPAAFFASLASRRLWIVLVVFVSLSVAVEVAQKWMDVGTCEVGDMTRNGCGAVVAVLLVGLMRAMRGSVTDRRG